MRKPLPASRRQGLLTDSLSIPYGARHTTTSSTTRSTDTGRFMLFAPKGFIAIPIMALPGAMSMPHSMRIPARQIKTPNCISSTFFA